MCFNGGKGVATSLAVISCIEPTLGLIAAITFAIMFISFKIVSISSLTAALATSTLSAFIVDGETAYLVIALSLMIFWRHKENILRILEGTEKKI
jgi:glycerol-3-phosphate acyltransferase PlsY